VSCSRRATGTPSTAQAGHDAVDAARRHRRRTRTEWDLGEQLDADGHTIYLASDRVGAIAKLSTHAVDLMILGTLQRPAEAPALLRDLRAGELHALSALATARVTIWAADDVNALRACDAHPPSDAGLAQRHRATNTPEKWTVRGAFGTPLEKESQRLGRALNFPKPAATDLGPAAWPAVASTENSG